MTALLTLFFFLLIISFLVFVHELGHFLAAKAIKADVKAFAIGFGPTLLKKHYKGTNYMIKLLPLGGYVELEGEQTSEGPNSFRNKSFLQKTFVLSAGVIVNTFVAVALLLVNLQVNAYNFELLKFADHTFTHTEKQVEGFPLQVTGFAENSIAQEVLQENDTIIAFNNEPIQSYPQFRELLKANQGKEITLGLIDLQSYDTRDVKLTLGQENADGSILGVSLFYPPELGKPVYFIDYKNDVVSAFANTYDLFVYQFKAIGGIIRNAQETGNYEELSQTVGGPLALAEGVNRVVEVRAFQSLFFLTGLISLSLATINILPIPALDGGQIAVAAIESIRRKRLSDDTLAKFNFAGFMFIIALSLLITFKDVIQFDILGGLAKLFGAILGR